MSSTPPSTRRWCRLKQINDGCPRGGHDATGSGTVGIPRLFQLACPRRTRPGKLGHVTKFEKFQLPCPQRARPRKGRGRGHKSGFNYRAREGHDTGAGQSPGTRRVSTTVPAKGTTKTNISRFCGKKRFNYRAREGHDGITVLYGNTNIFFPILREVYDLRICMVLYLYEIFAEYRLTARREVL